MKVSKYLHSCLLVEEQGRTILIDPGQFTFEERGFPLDSLEKLDYVLITHEHFDHFWIPFLNEILRKFPNVEILSNSSVAAILAGENMTVSTAGSKFVELEEVPHERIFSAPIPPKNTLFRVFGRLTHPGDSLSFSRTTEILALPVQAPWGSTTQAVELALSLKPKVVIPIHDWHWKDAVRKSMYERLRAFFLARGIDFRGLETGETIEL